MTTDAFEIETTYLSQDYRVEVSARKLKRHSRASELVIQGLLVEHFEHSVTIRLNGAAISTITAICGRGLAPRRIVHSAVN